MYDLISIDPGVKALGAAVWSGGRLKRALCSVAPHGLHLGGCVEWHIASLHEYLPREVALEVMQERRMVPSQDLMDVNVVGGIVAGTLSTRVVLCTSQSWKGGTPKSVNHARTRAQLDDGETKILAAALASCPKRHHKEILDAVGIGLWSLGRSTR